MQYHVDEPALAGRGLTNYWGYNTLGFFCPDPRLATTPDDPSAVNAEFRAMVATLHEHGLEVVLDVVYNHTPEGNEAGPTISFRGIDNASWYRLMPDDAGRFENLTGCGNTVNVAHPHVTQFVLDSLRYWVQEMGVDGFRFDLAPVLGRTPRNGFQPDAPFFTALRQDPILARVHLIAEPWDAAPDGYQVGRFPGRFLEWNDKFRDTVRRYWLFSGTPQAVSRGELARRFTASSDLFNHGQRTPLASVNFIAVHDGYTLADLTSYARKHNEANGENNRDGRDGEPSANFGVEGADRTTRACLASRARVRRAMIATLLLAQGTPMLCAGDEIGNSQQGNNNAYCHDSPITWLDWPSADTAFLRFVTDVLALRRAHATLRPGDWRSTAAVGAGAPRLTWLERARRRDGRRRLERRESPGLRLPHRPGADRRRAGRPRAAGDLQRRGSRARLPPARRLLAARARFQPRAAARRSFPRPSSPNPCTCRRARWWCFVTRVNDTWISTSAPPACCCTPLPCPARTASATSAPRPSSSSTGWCRPASRSGSCCPPRRSARATRRTRACRRSPAAR